MRNTLNETACAALITNVHWTEPRLVISLSVLALINVMVIVGNCLVIAAVFCSSKLRSVTNLFIVSLAVADLLVGVAVLPFSALWEVYKVTGGMEIMDLSIDIATDEIMREGNNCLELIEMFSLFDLEKPQ